MQAMAEYQGGDALAKIAIALDCIDGVDARAEKWLIRAKHLVNGLLAAAGREVQS